MKTNQTQYLKVSEVAERLNCSKRTVERRIQEGVLAAVQEGGRKLVHSWSVEAYLASLQPAGGAR